LEVNTPLKGWIKMKWYFLVFERETGKVIGKTYDEEVAISYIEKDSIKYDYQSYVEE
jgi:hypothetical protein